MGTGRRIIDFIGKRQADAESVVVRALAAQLGISWAVRYLRNPNHLITVSLLRSLGAQIGEGTRIKGSLFIDNAFEDPSSTHDFTHLKIGKNCYVGDGVFLDLANEIVLGDNVVVSARAAFATHADCQRSPAAAKHFPRQCQPVTVGDGAWIALGAVILCGVRIGEGSVIAANSVVRQGTKPRTLYAGSPAKEIRSLPDETQ